MLGNSKTKIFCWNLELDSLIYQGVQSYLHGISKKKKKNVVGT